LNSFYELGVIVNNKKPIKQEVINTINELKRIFELKTSKKSDLVNAMSKIIAGFNHIETGKSLDQKM